MHATHFNACNKCDPSSAASQDLSRTKLIVWTPNITRIFNSNTSSFFAAWQDFIQVREFCYELELLGTPWEHHPFFSSHAAVKAAMPVAATYSDLVRLLLMHNHGGLWLDNDMVLYRVRRTFGPGFVVRDSSTGLKGSQAVLI